MIDLDVAWMGVVGLILVGVYQVIMVGWVLLRPQRLQSSSLAWILVILGLPLVGGFAFLLFGQVWADKNRARRHREIVARVRAHLSEGWAHLRPVQLPLEGQGLALLAERGGEMAVRPGNEITLFSESDEVIRAMARDIDQATDHCHVLTYIYLDDNSGQIIARALMDAVQRGVSCRLLVDSLGSGRFLKSDLRQEMAAGGVQVLEALPTRFKLFARGRVDIRNHRKIMVVDGEIGWAGSQNIADAAFAVKAKYAPWVDCTLRIQGPIVRDLQELFVEDWYMDSREPLEQYLDDVPERRAQNVAAQLMPSGVNSKNDTLVQVIQAGIQLAREEVVLTTPYFVPDEGTLSALVTAAARGVHTQLVVPNRNDSPLIQAASRSYYEPLLEAGVEIHEFTKGLLHSKTITVDRRGALVGTANLDRRSFEINFELSVLIFDDDVASQVRALQRSYMEDSVQVDLATFKARPRMRRIWENTCGLLSPLL